MSYHHGKLICEAKTMVTEAMEDHIKALAAQSKCQPSELIREALYAAFTGVSFSGHVANDRLSVMHLQGSNQGEKGASK